MKEQHKNLIGKKFGYIIIKNIVPYYRGHKNKYRDYKANIFCESCQHSRVMLLRNITGGSSKSCGCLKYKTRLHGLNNKLCNDLRGKKFGHLAPIEVDVSKTSRVYWKCICDCGKYKSIPSGNLTNNKATSCGCKHYLTGKDSPLWKGYEEISSNYWKSIIRGAKQRKILFEISIEYIWGIFLKQNRRCALTGLPLSFNSKSIVLDGNASLDRIDSSKGYVEGNVWWVDKTVNTTKWDLTLDNFLKVCKLVVDYNEL